MNDGRILYTRWEYVHKGCIAVQSLWAMRPDGSGSQEYLWQRARVSARVDSRPLRARVNHLFVATCTMHHPFAVGPILLINTQQRHSHACTADQPDP